MTFERKEVVDVGLNLGELLQASHPSKPQHLQVRHANERRQSLKTTVAFDEGQPSTGRKIDSNPAATEIRNCFVQEMLAPFAG